MTGDLYQSPLRYGATYEESSADGVTPRPHWAHLMESLRAIGPEELGHRWARAERRIRENGITYNIYGDPARRQPPLAHRHRSAAHSCRGVALHRGRRHPARAAPQPAARRSVRPAGAADAAATFRPRCSTPTPPFCARWWASSPAHSYLHMLAVDLARSPDGQWWVLADRTQAPSGSGYALENRTIVSDVLPELFRTSNVLRLAPFFRAQRDALTSLASRTTRASCC